MCDHVELNSDISSLNTLMDNLKIFIKDTIQTHIHCLSIGAPHWQYQCIDCFKTFCIGKSFVGSELCAMIASSNIFNLLNMIQCIASGYSVMFHCDVTSKASSLAFNRLHFASTCSATIPAETESEHTYTEVYKAAHSATKRNLTLPSCGSQECKSCT